MWVFKFEGKTVYVNHAEFKNVNFSTKETPLNPHTKGSIKIKNAILDISTVDGRIEAMVEQEK